MKKSFMKIVVATFMVLSTPMHAQIKNLKTETVKVYGNCGMCETTIEKAGSIKKMAKVDWNQETQMATLTYDAKKTNQDEILRRIALVGYDSDKFLAPDDVYNNLHGCCQYDRVAKVSVKADAVPLTNKAVMDMNNNATVIEDQLTKVFDNYFGIKDALVKSDAATASVKAKELLSAINAVKMDNLEMDVHMIWMKVLDRLKTDAENISKSKDVAKQRDQFNSLSKNIYELIKVSKLKETIYYDYCPMKDANWLSKENSIKNPYYGSQMLSCGKTVETIK